MIDGDSALSGRREPLRLAGLFASLGLTLFVFAPGQIYLGNPDEFTTVYASLAAVGLVLASLMGLLGCGLGALLPVQEAHRTGIVVAALTVLCWFQGTYLLWDYGVLDGRAIPWGEMWSRGLLDSAVWVVALVAACYCSTRCGRQVVNAALVVVAVQAIALGNLWLQSPDAESPAASAATPGAMFEFGPGTNVLHIVMDGFQSDIFAEILDDDLVPGIRQSLDGFTFFEQHTGTFPYTQMTMPLIVSGRVYQNEQTVADFTAEAMRGENVLNAAEAAGFEVDIAAQPALRNVYGQGEHTNAFTIPSNLHATEADYFTEDALRLADLSLFRVAPHFLRYLVHQDELWLLQRLSNSGSYPGLRYFAELDFLRQFRESMAVTREHPTYKLFHLMISHRPTVGTADCEFDGIRATTRPAVLDQSTCGLKQVIAVLDRMKDLGIYDDALIVLMADHGAWIGPKKFASLREGYDGPKAASVGLSIPLLAIKPPHSTGALTESSAPSDIGDVARTIADLAGLHANLPGRQVFELDESDPGSRYFYDYAYGDNREKSGYLYTLLEYQIDGSPLDQAAWSKRRRLMAGGQEETVALAE